MAVARALTLVYFLIAALTAAIVASSVIAAPSVKKAPQWDISEWINSEPINLSDLKGQVVVIDFFQLWCPGCKSFSIPLMDHWEKKVFKKEAAEGRIAFVSIHTVFEGHNFQTPKRLRRFLKEKAIEHPVGIDRHIDGRRIPETMRRYKTMGTPEMAIIDKNGNLRFQRFGYFEPAFGENLIRTLLEEQSEPERASLFR